MKRFFIIIVALASILLSAHSANSPIPSGGVGGGYSPWTFWYWMYGAVSKEGIKADLQGMKDIGLGGCYLMPIRGAEEAPSNLPQLGEAPAQQLTPQFWEMVRYAMQQADSLGLEMGIHICDGFALAGGPWITPDESMQKVVYCDTILEGGFRHFRMHKPQHYENYYKDIAVYAIPVKQDKPGVPKISFSPEVTINAKGVYCADKPCWIQYEFDKETLVRNIEIEPSGTNIQCQRMRVKVSHDGVNFQTVKQLTPPRQGWQNTGFKTTFSIPPRKVKYVRLEWTPEGSEPGAEDLDAAKWKPVLRLKGAKFGSWPLIDNWEGKAGYVWRIAPETSKNELATNDYLLPQNIISAEMIGDLLEIDLPKGLWHIIRIGHTSTGHTNATAGGAKGLECDKFSKAAVNKQIDSWFGEFLKLPHANVLKYLHVDSWECGSQNWSKNFAEEFQKRRGYDLIPWLPVMVGVPIESAAKSEQVLRDIRLTINDLINDVFFATVRDRAHQMGMEFSSESVAPTMVSDGIEHYQYADLPMGEFWLNSPTHDKPNDMLDAISGAHIYGKPIVQAEGFTEVRGVWDETPAMVKPLLDRNFALGMNKLFFHVNTHNPWLDKKPGMTLDGIGLFFQRDQTWYPEAKSFVDYITRCQTLLQKGKPVVDIAVYTGEEVPSRALTPDKLVPMLPGLFGAERVASEHKRLANVGQPMEESPVGVRHSANILDMKDWINPLHGYQYDSMNKDALLTQPFNYKVLVVPEGSFVSDEVQKRIETLRQQGVVIIEKPYKEADFSAFGLAPDVILPDGIAFTHRHMGEFGEVYFLSNQENRERTFTASFRAALYSDVVIENPLTTGYTMMDDCVVNNPRTDVPLTLPAYGSVFVHLSSAIGYWPVVHQRTPLSTCLHQRRLANSPKYEFTNGWDILFRENGMRIHSDSLFDWSCHLDDRIKYYSGHACYSTSFKCKGKPVKTMLCLGDVRDIAHVWVNGKDCGIVWTAPYEVDITEAVRKGKNKIEIEVVNTWHNALRGADIGKAPYDGIWTNAKYRTKGDGLMSAGLLEPPVIKTITN